MITVLDLEIFWELLVEEVFDNMTTFAFMEREKKNKCNSNLIINVPPFRTTPSHYMFPGLRV